MKINHETRLAIISLVFLMVAVIVIKSFLKCSDPLIVFSTKPSTILFYTKGDIAKEGSLDPKFLTVALSKLIARKEGNWKFNFVNHAHNYVIKSENYMFDLHKGFLIVQYNDIHSRWREVVTNLSNNEYQKIVEIINNFTTWSR